MLGLCVPGQIRALEDACRGLDRGRVERNHTVARLALAPPDVQQPLDEVNITATKMLHLGASTANDPSSVAM